MLKIGMIGAGHIANTHAACLQKISEVGIAGMFDTTQERAADMAERYGANTYHNLDSMLSEVDAVYVCTPPKFHREAAIEAIESGIHVFCEKPLTVTVEDAEAIEEAVNRSDVVFAVGFNLRFSRDSMEFKKLVESGKLGNIYQFWSIRFLWSPHLPPNWRTDPRFLCGMTIESLSHDFDFMRWIAGDVDSVMGRVATSRSDLDGYDNIVNALMGLRNGGIANIQASWANHAGTRQYGVIGSLGSATYEKGMIRWRTEKHSSEEVMDCRKQPEGKSSYQLESEHFINCIKTGEKPMISVDNGVATVKISHAVLRSSEQGCVVNLDRGSL